MSDRFVVEADRRVVGIAIRVKGGFRFFTSDRRFRALESRTFPKLKAVIARATEISRAHRLGDAPTWNHRHTRRQYFS